MKKLLLLTAMMIASVGLTIAQPGFNSYHGGHGGNTGYNSAYDHGPPIMSQGEFQYALQSMDRQSFDSGKLTVAKQIIRNNSMQSQQILVMVRRLSFESNRLKLAKFAYRQVVDPHNYHVVNQGFHYSSSVRNLDRYMAANPVQGAAQVGYVDATPGVIHQGGGSVGLNSCATGQLNSGTLTVSGGISSVNVAPVHGGNVGFNAGAVGHPLGYTTMCPSEFNRLKCSIERQCFDGDKFRIARQALCTKLITSQQVLEVMHLFSFESNKLKFAKFAYEHTCDQHNYWVVNDGFTFGSSVRNLECYINSIG